MADRDEEEQARRARADFEVTPIAAAPTPVRGPVLALPAPGRATATPACGTSASTGSRSTASRVPDRAARPRRHDPPGAARADRRARRAARPDRRHRCPGRCLLRVPRRGRSRAHWRGTGRSGRRPDRATRGRSPSSSAWTLPRLSAPSNGSGGWSVRNASPSCASGTTGTATTSVPSSRRPSASRTTSWASPTCGRTRSSATTSGSTARWTGSRLLRLRRVDRVYDQLRRPRGCARSSSCRSCPRPGLGRRARPCFEYGAIVSPPKDWDAGATLVARARRTPRRPVRPRRGTPLVLRGVERANLEVFWTGTREGVPAALRRDGGRGARRSTRGCSCGGPSTAAWNGSRRCGARRAPGSPARLRDRPTPTATRRWTSVPCSSRHGRQGMPTWWTEWGVTPTRLQRGRDP